MAGSVGSTRPRCPSIEKNGINSSILAPGSAKKWLGGHTPAFFTHPSPKPPISYMAIHQPRWGSRAKLPPGMEAMFGPEKLTQRRSSLCRPTRENTRGDATGITPDPPGHSVGGTAHITLQSRIVAGCVCRVIRLVIGLDPGKGPCCSRLTCLITRGIGSAPLKTIYYAEHPGKSGTLRRHTLFEDRPTSSAFKKDPTIGTRGFPPPRGTLPGIIAGLFGPGSAGFLPRLASSCRATIYRTGCSPTMLPSRGSSWGI